MGSGWEAGISDIWISFKQGDRKSFESLFNYYYPRLISYGRKFTPNKYIIEESVQDLFVKLWNNRHTLGIPASVKPYILKSFRSIIFRKLSKVTLSGFERLDEANYQFNIEIAPDQALIEVENRDEASKRIHNSINRLTPRQREAIYLRFFQDLSYEEISDILRIDVGGTYKLIYRALDRLKMDLGPALFVIFLSSFSSTSFII